MTLAEYLKTLTKPESQAFAGRCSTTVGQLKQVAYGHRTANPQLCVLIESQTNKLVTRPTLRPGDWKDIWPELATKDNHNDE